MLLSVKRRLSKLSSNEKIFNNSIPTYQEALIKTDYNHKLTYQKYDQNKNNSDRRKRQIIWFNPPYSKNVTTKVGKFFLSLSDRHFPPLHKLRRLFNCNNVKISQNCLKLLCPSLSVVRRTCNLINIPQCPLQRQYLNNNILYQASITPIGENSETKVYYGICEATFEQGYANQKELFNHRNRKSDTEVSKKENKSRK